MEKEKFIELKIEELDSKIKLINENIDSSINDKITYVVKKLLKNIDSAKKPKYEELLEKFELIEVDNALLDEKNCFITKSDNKFTFTKENWLKVKNSKKDLIKIYNQEIVSVKIPILIDLEKSEYKREDKKGFDLYFVEELKGLLFI